MARGNGRKSNKQAGRNNSRVSPKPKLDYSVRYGNNYSRECAKAIEFLNKYSGLCCCCLKAKFKELHHTKYGGNQLGINWFPVCERCHTTACHALGTNWIIDKLNPVWGNKNTETFASRLLLGYKLLYNQPPPKKENL